MNIHRKPHGKKKERGQVLILCAVSMTVLILFAGLAVDFGLAYVTRANLGKAVDAAALTGLKNLTNMSGSAQSSARALALSAFAMNYPDGGRNASAPAVTVNFTTVPTFGNPQIQVQATATINTYFIRLLPAFKTLTITDVGQATRAKVLMTLVLDRSGSLENPSPQNPQADGGGAALPGALTNFLSNFDNSFDDIAVVTFASNVGPTQGVAPAADVPMPQQGDSGGFLNPIDAIIGQMANINQYFQGGTNTVGAMNVALTTINGISVPAGQSAVKVVVLFTDGDANTIATTTSCQGNGGYAGSYTIGGYDDPNYGVAFMTTNYNPGFLCQQNPNANNCCNHGTYPSPLNNNQATTINWSNVNADALGGALGYANSMRANGVYVYTIGLGSGQTNPITGAPIPNMPWLQQVANDPSSTAFNGTLPIGKAEPATNSNLTEVFQLIANDIKYRLTQ